MSDHLDRLKTLTSASFTPHLDTPFTVQLDDSDPWILTLAEVSELAQERFSSDTDAEPVKAFSLIFSHPLQDTYLTQGTFTIQHEQLGELALFLVPLGPEQGMMRYQAVFT